MQKLAKYLTITLLLCCTFGFYSKAAPVEAGSITYQWVRDSTYKVFVYYSRDCDLAFPPDSVAVCYTNTCLQQSPNLIRYGKPSVGYFPANIGAYRISCPFLQTRCQDPNSIYKGFRNYRYETEITLPSRCENWLLRATPGVRSPANNLPNGGTLYLKATLNNIGSLHNSSPSFSVYPAVQCCINQQFIYNNGVVDINNDSLTFSFIESRTANAACDNPSIIPFLNGASVAQPIPMSNIQINSETGQITFTPTSLETYSVALLVKEYDASGVLKGSVTRELRFEIVPCQPNVAYIEYYDTATLAIQSFYNRGVEMVVGRPSSFCYNIQSFVASSSLAVTDNFSTIAPNSTVTYTGQNTDSVKICFTWTPTINDIGTHLAELGVTDTNCKQMAFTNGGLTTIPIFVRAEYPTRIANFSNTDIKVYPNPTSGILKIATDKPVVAKVYSLIGRLLFNEKVRTSIDLSALANGMYVLQLFSPEDGELLSVQKIQLAQ